jgi:hypothetical protein
VFLVPAPITTVCEPDAMGADLVLSCGDAFQAALRSAGVDPRKIRLAYLAANAVCDPPCSPVEPPGGQVRLFLVDQTTVGVTVRLMVDGSVLVDGPVVIPADRLPPLPPFPAPPPERPAFDGSPPEVAERAAAPFCGSEDAGVAGPFDLEARSCFLAAILTGQHAEFVSERSDVEGNPFLEIWRSHGGGPVVIYSKDVAGWSRLECTLLIADDRSGLFGHTECTTDAFP